MQKILKYARNHGFLVGTVGIIIVLTALIVGRVVARNNAPQDQSSNTHDVTLVKASTFSNNNGSIFADGTVESLSQADLKSQVSAPLSAVYVSLGSTLRAGQTLAVFKNADLVAELDRAKANRALTLGQNGTGLVSLDSARQNALNTIKDAFSNADDTVHGKLDPFIFNNQLGSQQLSNYTTDWRISQDISTERGALDAILNQWKQRIDSLTTSSDISSITDALTLSQTNIKLVTRLLDKVSLGLNDATKSSTGNYSTTVNGWKTTVTTQRGIISGIDAALTGAKSSIQTAQSTTGATADAGVALADAGIKSINAQLAKTYITSPISGKIAALPFRVGELVSPGQLVATVVGSGGLQVKAYISSADFPKIKQGAAVMIQGSIPGTITTISPSVDEQNKKVEVTILISNSETSGLVVGQNVTTTIEATPSTSGAATTTTSYFLPIQNVKITAGSASVYTVDGDSKIKDNPVTLGVINGDVIEVTSGITDDMSIVSPVYERNPGEIVRVR